MRFLQALFIIALTAFSSTFFIENQAVFVEEVEAACSPGYYHPNGNGSCATAQLTKNQVKSTLFNDFMKIFDIIAGCLLAFAILVIVYSGYKIMTAAGEPQELEKGKRLLLSAGIGIVIILSSYTIMRLFISIIPGNV